MFANEHFGPYELRGELGRGAMACVWRAWDPNLEREVAIKEPLFEARYSEAILEEMGRRFVSEGRTQASLSHPNIVTIYAADVWESRPAIVMELVDGETLASRLARGPMTAAEALPILEQLLDAVGYAHAHGVVHRDIKPENIFITRSGLVKLADFGIARVESSTATMGTVAGMVLGTPGYMSPEQATGATVDARSDLFSVGVVAYEMLSGANPFGAGLTDTTTLIYRIVHEPASDLPDDVAVGIPSDMRPAIMCALAKDPNDRPQSAAEFLDILHGQAMPRTARAQLRNDTRMNYASPAPPVTAAASQRQGSLPSWLPYALVAAVAAVVFAFVLSSALGGGHGGGAAGGSAPGGTTDATQGTVSASDATYFVGTSNGYVAIFSNSSDEPLEVTKIATKDLRKASRSELKKTVGAASYDDAKAIVEAYRSEAEVMYAEREAEEKRKAEEAAAAQTATNTVQITIVGADGTSRTESIRRQGSTERVIPDSNTRALSDSEIYALSDAERCIAWNEIIAAYSGYQFKNGGLSNYFYSCSWYTPSGGSGAAPAGVAGENVQRLQDATSSWWKNLATY